MKNTGYDTNASPTPAFGPDQEFQKYISDKKFQLQQCEDCGIVIFMPRVICPNCASLTLKWRPACGLGTIYSQATLRPRSKAGEPPPPPHSVVLVDLDEGPRMMSHLPGVAPEDIHVGMRVQARIESNETNYFITFQAIKNKL